jgi:hypothetical protein
MPNSTGLENGASRCDTDWIYGHWQLLLPEDRPIAEGFDETDKNPAEGRDFPGLRQSSAASWVRFDLGSG